jgi:Transcriptional regulator, AbiEi antitoxin
MRPKLRTVDQIIAALAARAHGVVSRVELLAAGITSKEIRQRLERGSLLKVFRGVYRVGHAAPSTEALYMAAVKPAGEGARLSGPAAAHLLSITRGKAPTPEVTAATERLIKGVDTKRSKLHPSECTTWNRIPCTTPARTLLDLAATLEPDALSRAVHEASVRFKTTPKQIEAVIARHPRAKNAGTLRDIARGDLPTILSKLERAFITFLKQHKLPPPKTNRPAGAHYVDCRWPDHHLTVELDSYAFHNTRHSWQQDRKRERDAYERGDQFRRYTWHDVTEDQRQMRAELVELLKQS